MKDLQTSINDLTWPVSESKGQKLRDPPPAQPIKQKVGIGKPSATAKSTTSGTFDLGGPLTVTSSDGLFTWYYAETLVVNMNGIEYRVPVVA